MLFLRRMRTSGVSFTKLRQNYSTGESGHKIVREKLKKGPGLKDFIMPLVEHPFTQAPPVKVPYLSDQPPAQKQKVFFDVYGCQMNVNDTEIVWSILKDEGFERTEVQDEADVFLVMTCSIREGAESKIWRRLDHLRGYKRRRLSNLRERQPVKIGILGCMAERLKEKLIEKEKSVDLVCGPDSYRDLPRLLAVTESGQAGVNVMLSLDETYADVMPVRLNEDAVTAFVSIMRGCDNMCTYCIVPFTRGRERSRPVASIVEEVRALSQQGVKEVTLLGQNVNSYRDLSETTAPVETKMAEGFRTVYKRKKGGLRFADLLEKVSSIDPEMRIRFTSPHPKDFPDEVLEMISSRDNVCKSLHLPAQSGSSAVLERMRRGYTREAYLDLIRHVRQLLPGVGLTSDFICGFCGETDEEFEETLTLMQRVGYHIAYLYPYSMREKTTAHRRFADDVPEPLKKERHIRMAELFRRMADDLNRAEIGSTHLILVAGRSRRSEDFVAGRNEHNVLVIVPQMRIEDARGEGVREMKPGDFVAVKITDANSQVLKGTPLFHTSISHFYRSRGRRESVSAGGM